jgi:hypothetical protein
MASGEPASVASGAAAVTCAEAGKGLATAKAAENNKTQS